jgi:hypothetical protein
MSPQTLCSATMEEDHLAAIDEQAAWLESIPEDDSPNKIGDADFVPVKWIEGIGFVRAS